MAAPDTLAGLLELQLPLRLLVLVLPAPPVLASLALVLRHGGLVAFFGRPSPNKLIGSPRTFPEALSTRDSWPQNTPQKWTKIRVFEKDPQPSLNYFP